MATPRPPCGSNPAQLTCSRSWPCSKTRLKASKKRASGPRGLARRSSIAERAGESVRALKAEMRTEIAIVTANCCSGALDAAHESDGHEHRGEDQRDATTGPRPPASPGGSRRAATCLPRCVLDRLDDDDGVVDHEADGEHEAQRESELIEKPRAGRPWRCRSADRDRDGRDQRRAPVLKEQVDHQNDEHHRLAERDDDFADALRDGLCRVERVGEFEVLRKASISCLVRVWRMFLREVVAWQQGVVLHRSTP